MYSVIESGGQIVVVRYPAPTAHVIQSGFQTEEGAANFARRLKREARRRKRARMKLWKRIAGFAVAAAIAVAIVQVLS